jgi:hypothetical protein
VLSTRSLPEATCGAKPVESAAAMIWPPRMDCIMSALPLKGMWLSSMPTRCAMSSIVRCGLVSTPVEP